MAGASQILTRWTWRGTNIIAIIIISLCARHIRIDECRDSIIVIMYDVSCDRFQTTVDRCASINSLGASFNYNERLPRSDDIGSQLQPYKRVKKCLPSSQLAATDDRRPCRKYDRLHWRLQCTCCILIDRDLPFIICDAAHVSTTYVYLCDRLAPFPLTLSRSLAGTIVAVSQQQDTDCFKRQAPEWIAPRQ